MSAVIRRIGGQVLGATLLFWFLAGLLAIVAVPYELYRMARARSWPSREAVVTKAVASPQGSTRRTFWEPAIRVKYADTGEEAWMTRVRYGEFRLRHDRESARADVRTYKPGTVVRVYYSPVDPRDTLLEPFAPRTTMLWTLGIGAAGVLLPVVLFLFRTRA